MTQAEDSGVKYTLEVITYSQCTLSVGTIWSCTFHKTFCHKKCIWPPGSNPIQLSLFPSRKYQNPDVTADCKTIGQLWWWLLFSSLFVWKAIIRNVIKLAHGRQASPTLMCPKWPGNSDIPSRHVWHLKFRLMVLKKVHGTPAQLLLPVVVWSSTSVRWKIDSGFSVVSSGFQVSGN